MAILRLGNTKRLKCSICGKKAEPYTAAIIYDAAAGTTYVGGLAADLMVDRIANVMRRKAEWPEGVLVCSKQDCLGEAVKLTFAP